MLETKMASSDENSDTADLQELKFSLMPPLSEGRKQLHVHVVIPIIIV